MGIKKFALRAWFYFRQGWSTYFAFVFAAINTLIVTYYLAIDNLPILKEIFPSFAYYVIVLVSIGIPLLITIGYIHYKKSGAFQAEADIGFEANPHFLRMLSNSEAMMPLHLKMIELLLKLSKDEKLTDVEINEIADLQKKLQKHLTETTMNDLKQKSS